MLPKHTHKYIRFRFKNGSIAFRCAIWGCSHYILEELIVGRQSICWICNKEFVIDERSARLRKPHCNCKKRREDILIHQLTDELLKEGV